MGSLRLMEAPEFYSLEEGYAVLRPRGELPLQEAIDLITRAIVFARESGVRRLLVVLHEVTGLQSPGLAARYQFVRQWARASEGLVRLSLALPEEMIDQNRFGLTVAANAGMTTDIFVDEAEALAWLMGEG